VRTTDWGRFFPTVEACLAASRAQVTGIASIAGAQAVVAEVSDGPALQASTLQDILPPTQIFNQYRIPTDESTM